MIDVNREDAWDKVQDFLEGMVEAVIGGIKGVIPKDLPLSLPKSLGGAAEDVQSFLLKKLAGGNRGSDSNGAKSHVKSRSWDRLASQDLSPSVSQGTIWRYVAVDRRLGYA